MPACEAAVELESAAPAETVPLHPGSVSGVHDEPALRDGCESVPDLCEACFGHARHATVDPMTSFSLRQVKLRPGEQFRDELEVELPAFEFGGQRYVPVPEQVPAAFEVTRANTGTVFTLGFTARLHGPCYRCLGDAVLEVPIFAREYQAENPEDEEMRTQYIVGANLDVSAVGARRGGARRCPTRSSAARTAPACAASAART